MYPHMKCWVRQINGVLARSMERAATRCAAGAGAANRLEAPSMPPAARLCAEVLLSHDLQSLRLATLEGLG